MNKLNLQIPKCYWLLYIASSILSGLISHLIVQNPIINILCGIVAFGYLVRSDPHRKGKEN